MRVPGAQELKCLLHLRIELPQLTPCVPGFGHLRGVRRWIGEFGRKRLFLDTSAFLSMQLIAMQIGNSSFGCLGEERAELLGTVEGVIVEGFAEASFPDILQDISGVVEGADFLTKSSTNNPTNKIGKVRYQKRGSLPTAISGTSKEIVKIGFGWRHGTSRVGRFVACEGSKNDLKVKLINNSTHRVETTRQAVNGSKARRRVSEGEKKADGCRENGANRVITGGSRQNRTVLSRRGMVKFC
jgi:hypothetical protein